MITRDHACLMADYNAWMNARLYELCAGIDDAERRAERGAFFGSLHATLNHILCIDLMFMFRLTGDPESPPGLTTELHPDFAAMHTARLALDGRIRDWAETLTPDLLEKVTRFTSVIDGKPRTVPLWTMVTQMFNHQTHHRGQASTLLSQMDHDVGTTDIPFMPRFEDATPE